MYHLRWKTFPPPLYNIFIIYFQRNEHWSIDGLYVDWGWFYLYWLGHLYIHIRMAVQTCWLVYRCVWAQVTESPERNVCLTCRVAQEVHPPSGVKTKRAINSPAVCCWWALFSFFLLLLLTSLIYGSEIRACFHEISSHLNYSEPGLKLELCFEYFHHRKSH